MLRCHQAVLLPDDLLDTVATLFPIVLLNYQCGGSKLQQRYTLYFNSKRSYTIVLNVILCVLLLLNVTEGCNFFLNYYYFINIFPQSNLLEVPHLILFLDTKTSLFCSSVYSSYTNSFNGNTHTKLIGKENCSEDNHACFCNSK